MAEKLYSSSPTDNDHFPFAGTGASSRSWVNSAMALASTWRLAVSQRAGDRCAVAVEGPCVAAAKSARVQKDSSAVLAGVSGPAGSSTRPAGRKPSREFSEWMAVLPASGSTTMRSTAGSAKRWAIAASMAAALNPGSAGPVPGPASSRCRPASPCRWA